MNRDSEILIIGAGLAGLSTAYHLSEDYLLIEKEGRVGGLARTERVNDFHFDYTGHLLHLRDDYTEALIKDLLEGNLVEKNRNSWIFSKNVFTRYPFQKNTYGLPRQVIEEIIAGFRNRPERGEANFEDWIYTHFGAGIASRFMIPYNKKIWTVPAREMTIDWMKGYVPQVSLEEVLEGAKSDVKDRVGYNASFFYPKKGGIESLPIELFKRLDSSQVILNAELARIDIKRKKAYLLDGSVLYFEKLVSTMPLKSLALMLDGVSSAVGIAARKLRHNSVINWNYGINAGRFKDKDWVYLPEEKFACYRVGFPSNFSPEGAPSGYTTCYTEIAYREEMDVSPEKARSRSIADLKTIGLIRSESEIEAELLLEIPCAYVIYDFKRKEAVSFLKEYLAERAIYSIGRYGNWEYSAMEDAILQGREMAETLNSKG